MVSSQLKASKLICNVLDLFTMHSNNFPNDPALTFLSKKNHGTGSQKFQNIVVGGFYGRQGKLASGFTNMALYF